MLPKRRYWKTEQRVGRSFSRYLAMVRSPNRVLAPSQGTSKTHSRPGVCHSSPFVGQSPFLPFRQNHQPPNQVGDFDEMVEMEIFQQMGRSGTRLVVPASVPTYFARLVDVRRVPLIPILWTISISNISTNTCTINAG